MSGNGNDIKKMSPAPGHYDPSFLRFVSFTGKKPKTREIVDHMEMYTLIHPLNQFQQ